MRSFRLRLTLKDRVALALFALVALFVGVQGLLAYLTIEEQEDDLADEWVLSESHRLSALAANGELHPDSAAAVFQPTPTLSAWLVDRAGQSIPGPLPDQLKALPVGHHRLSLASAELHVIVQDTGAGLLYVQYDASQPEAKVRRFGLYLLGLTMTCVLLGLAVSRWIASIVVGPINRLTERLSSWAPESGTSKSATSDEESRLLDAFHGVQARFEETVAREREFVANVRHEVRTPLAALRTDIELLALAEPANSPRHERLQRALSMIDAVAAALESARLLQQRAAPVPQAIDLARCVDDAWMSLTNHPSIDRLRFVNAVPPATILHAERHALLTILRNLIRNAAEHAAPAQCVVSYGEDGIEVSDDGPGIAPEQRPLVFERYYRGRLRDAPGGDPDDHGLGLAIARQVAELNGWRLSAAPRIGGGVRFLLQLP